MRGTKIHCSHWARLIVSRWKGSSLSKAESGGGRDSHRSGRRGSPSLQSTRAGTTVGTSPSATAPSRIAMPHRDVRHPAVAV